MVGRLGSDLSASRRADGNPAVPVLRREEATGSADRGDGRAAHGKPGPRSALGARLRAMQGEGRRASPVSCSSNGEEIDSRRGRLQCRSQDARCSDWSIRSTCTQLPAEAAALSDERHGRQDEPGAWRLPKFKGVDGDAAALSRQDSDFAGDRLPGARLRRLQIRRVFAAVRISSHDSHVVGLLAGARRASM